ncbi:hypothetical protein GGU10DRAFT_117829 [Lentinula aff. detonsa]|uniref:Uncharacterized protein n=1 Tax=Lentinula aff. detonsa TaxID=2804958 RepID=A0AA38NNF7_9AGAR|nr:hypothetical protein GGU10DRAFT_117829 [Lentinula aff. detonsa]
MINNDSFPSSSNPSSSDSDQISLQTCTSRPPTRHQANFKVPRTAMSSDSNQDPLSNSNISRPPPRYQTKLDDSRPAISSDLNQNPPSNANTSPRHQAKFDDSQLPRRPATTAAEVPVTTTITGTFFAGAHHFGIHGGEFTHTAGNLYKTIRSDHSTRSNFDNSYGHDYSGSGNRANNYHGPYNDQREFRSQRYEASFMDMQCTFCLFHGLKFNPNCHLYQSYPGVENEDKVEDEDKDEDEDHTSILARMMHMAQTSSTNQVPNKLIRTGNLTSTNDHSQLL